MWMTRATWIALALTFVVLARGLPAETFFVGDPGVKLVAAREAIAHPATPFEVSLPKIGDQRVALVDPFFMVHGDHAHAITSEVFPVLNAPLIAIFGIRGAYVLPAAGFLLALWASPRLARAIGCRASPAMAVLASALGTPLLFYGLEFWEHAPAVAMAAIATTVLFKDTTTEQTGGRGFGRLLLAGALFGISVLLRPEAFWFFLAVAFSSRLLTSPPGWSAIAIAAAGMALPLAPLAIYSLVHFGTIAPPHLETQADLLTIGWLNTRAGIITAWFAPDALRATPLWGCALVLTAVSGLAIGGRRGPGRFLAGVVLLDVALVAITAPNDGGGQWGPRYLLFAFIPASLLLADAVHALSGRAAVAGIAATAVLFAAGAWIQRSGYRELRGTKIMYGRVLDLVEQEVPPGGYAVTDVWWLDQVAAFATDERTILFAANEDSRRDALRRLHSADVATVVAFTTGVSPDDLEGWKHAPCYQAESEAAIELPRLAAVALRRLPQCE